MEGFHLRWKLLLPANTITAGNDGRAGPADTEYTWHF